MTIEEALQRKLKEVVGNDRVYPDAVPNDQATWPCVVYLHAGDDEEYGLSGGQPRDHIDTFSLEVWGKERAAVVAVRDALKGAFAGENCQGVWGGAGGVVVAGAFCREAIGGVTPAIDSSDKHDRSEVLSLRVFWYGA